MWILALSAGCTSDHQLPPPLGTPPDLTSSLGSATSPHGTTPHGTTTAPATCSALAAEEGDYVRQGTELDGEGAACVARTHATAGAAGSTLTLHVDVDAPVIVSAVDPGGRALLDPTEVDSGADLAISPIVTGEVLVTLTPQGPDAYGYTVGVDCADGCDRWWTRYPILFMHGMSGGSVFDGVLDYYFQVPEDLTDKGLVVLAPAVDPYETPEVRGPEWEPYLDELLAEGHRRVNLIAHSQGGMDARLLASPAGLDRGADIASVTTVATPHLGSKVADLVDGVLQSGVLDPDVLDIGAAVFGSLLGLDVSDPEMAVQIHSLSTPVAAQFDATYVDAPDTDYASWAGHSCGILEWGCIGAENGEIVDPLLGAAYLIELPDANDGLVSVESAKHGRFLGEIPADHLDEVGQVADVANPPFDHLAFYEREVMRLQGEDR